MSFFYDLNKRLADLATKTQQEQLAESKKAEAVAQSPLTRALTESAVSEGHKGEITKTAKGLKHRATSAYGGEKDKPHALDRLKGPSIKQRKVADEGNAFTGALAKTPKGGKFELDGKEITDTSDLEETMTRQHFRHTADLLKNIEDPAKRKELAHHHAGIFKASNPRFDLAKFLKAANVVDEADVTGLGEEEMDEGFADMDRWLADREKSKGTGRFDSRKVSTGTVYTRKPETFDDPETDPEATGGAPKRKGRPAGTKRAIGAKGPGVKSKLLQKGAIAEESDEHVCEMCGQPVVEKAPPGAKAERMVKHIKKSLSKDGKLSDKDKAIAYATTWKAKKAGKVEEESTDKEDTKAERAGKKVAKDIEHDEGHKGRDDNRAEKAGKKVTKDIEYDDKKDKEEKVDETSDAPKSSKGMQFGKGVYESLDTKLETMIAEGMNVSVNMNSDAEGDAQKSITVTATGADADKLAELLKMAGLESKQETCPGCGSSDCGCEAEVVDENSPDWPTDKETLDAEPNLRTYSGGLNGPKSTGQTTTPVLASQLRRQTSMEENVELERSLFKTWSNYKG